ncbi:hypothetical protein DL98DRAFT_530332 [Cadophora sp. DSE1049]|nr:hypothetical protein DL98DRAFT_530332 [Cadophora sp. DSE1049]
MASISSAYLAPIRIIVRPYILRHIRISKGSQMNKLVFGIDLHETLFREAVKKYAETVTLRGYLSNALLNEMTNLFGRCQALFLIRTIEWPTKNQKWDPIEKGTMIFAIRRYLSTNTISWSPYAFVHGWKLKLGDSDWTWSRSPSSSLWDLSKLRCLSLKWSDLQNSILAAPKRVLTGLQTFKLHHRLYHSYIEEEYQMFFSSLFHDCQNLENFKIELEDWNEMISMRDITRLGGRLWKLKLIDNMESFLSVATGAHKLTDLTLHKGDILGVGRISPTSNDQPYDDAKLIMEQLHSRKLGQQFNMIKIHFDDWAKVHDDIDRGVYDDALHHTRWFFSRINDASQYEQWGSDSNEDPVEELRE